MPIYKGTHYVDPDEPCLGLYELNFKSPDQRSRHRYQIIVVMRGDEPAEYRKDLGLAEKWQGVDQFRIPGGVYDPTDGKFYIEETVGRLMDFAEKMRQHPLFDKADLLGSKVAWKREPAKLYF